MSIPAKIQTCCCLIPRGTLQDRMRELNVWIQQQRVGILAGMDTHSDVVLISVVGSRHHELLMSLRSKGLTQMLEPVLFIQTIFGRPN